MAKTTQDREVRSIKRTFTFNLTTEEVADKARKIVDARMKVAELNGDMENMKQKFKGEIGAQENYISEESRKIKNNKESREVECDEVKDYKKFVVEYLYKGEVMETRAMTVEERQVELKLVQAKNKKYHKKNEENEAEVSKPTIGFGV